MSAHCRRAPATGDAHRRAATRLRFATAFVPPFAHNGAHPLRHA